MGLPRATALVFGLLLAAAAHAQPVFPSRPVTLVLPSAPGDPTDLIARVLQPKMSERLGQQFVIRSEEHTSELQSRLHLVCRLLLEKKKYHAHHCHRTTRNAV